MDRELTDERRSEYDAALAEIDYAFSPEPRDLKSELYGLEVTGLPGTDRQGETFHYRFQEGESLRHLFLRVVWERSWDGYSPLEEYLAAHPMPEPEAPEQTPASEIEPEDEQ